MSEAESVRASLGPNNFRDFGNQTIERLITLSTTHEDLFSWLLNLALSNYEFVTLSSNEVCCSGQYHSTSGFGSLFPPFERAKEILHSKNKGIPDWLKPQDIWLKSPHPCTAATSTTARRGRRSRARGPRAVPAPAVRGSGVAGGG